MNLKEQQLTKIVSKISLWLAPLPSAYFVARSATKHLGVTSPFDVIIALVLETLGIATMHTTLWLYGWNQESITPAGNLRRGRTLASKGEIILSTAMGALYLTTAILLIAVLEVTSELVIFAKALFPLFSIVGAVNLALIARQERRESALVEIQKETKETVKKEPKPKSSLVDFGNGRQATKEARKAVLITLLKNNQNLTAKEAAKSIGTSDQTIYNYLAELESDNIIERNEEGVKVK